MNPKTARNPHKNTRLTNRRSRAISPSFSVFVAGFFLGAGFFAVRLFAVLVWAITDHKP
jgi:hypothetical protein